MPHSITYNQVRRRDEIVLRLENIQKSGISVLLDSVDPVTGWVQYARPYVDEKPAELVLEIGGELTNIHFVGSTLKAEFFKDAKARITKLFELVSSKLNIPSAAHPLNLFMAPSSTTPQSTTPGSPLNEDYVRVSITSDSAITLDGKEYIEDTTPTTESSTESNPRKRRRGDDGVGDDEQWVVRTGQWRLRIQASPGIKSGVECVLVAVKLDAVSSQLGRNKTRGFLGS